MTDPLRPPDTDELRAPETDDEPWEVHGNWFIGEPQPDLRGVIYTVALLAGLTLAAIAWRLLR